MCAKYGLELTFLPDNPRSPQWSDKAVATRAARKLRTEWKVLLKGAPGTRGLLRIKVDRHRVTFDDRGDKRAWCLEVHSKPFQGVQLTAPHNADSKISVAIAALFSAAKATGLTPCVLKENRDGSLVEYATGGGHIHLGTNLWPDNWRYHLDVFALERAICMDYYNHPFIRWCWCQWFDDHNSRLPRRPDNLAELGDDKEVWAHESVIRYSSSICQRHAAYSSQKGHYPTYEFRFFDAPRSPDQLRLQIAFMDAWVGYHQKRVDSGEWFKEKWASYTWSARYQARLFKDAKFAEAQIRAFWEKLGLKWDEGYREMCFEEHYLPRMRGGKPL